MVSIECSIRSDVTMLADRAVKLALTQLLHKSPIVFC